MKTPDETVAEVEAEFLEDFKNATDPAEVDFLSTYWFGGIAMLLKQVLIGIHEYNYLYLALQKAKDGEWKARQSLERASELLS